MIGYWIGALSHTTSHREIMHNYVAGGCGQAYLAHGEALDVLEVGELNITQPNKNVWTL